jgi:hypothetical protein
VSGPARPWVWTGLFTCAAYDESMPEFARPGLTRPVRWSLWLGAGVLCGLILGFAIGLAKPRFRN